MKIDIFSSEQEKNIKIQIRYNLLGQLWTRGKVKLSNFINSEKENELFELFRAFWIIRLFWASFFVFQQFWAFFVFQQFWAILSFFCIFQLFWPSNRPFKLPFLSFIGRFTYKKIDKILTFLLFVCITKIKHPTLLLIQFNLFTI